MFGIKRLKGQIEELQKEVSRLVENQMYYEMGVTRRGAFDTTPTNLSEYASHWFSPCPQQPIHGKPLKAQDVLDRFAELYSALHLERKIIPGTETTTKLEKAKS